MDLSKFLSPVRPQEVLARRAASPLADIAASLRGGRQPAGQLQAQLLGRPGVKLKDVQAALPGLDLSQKMTPQELVAMLPQQKRYLQQAARRVKADDDNVMELAGDLLWTERFLPQRSKLALHWLNEAAVDGDEDAIRLLREHSSVQDLGDLKKWERAASQHLQDSWTMDAYGYPDALMEEVLMEDALALARQHVSSMRGEPLAGGPRFQQYQRQPEAKAAEDAGGQYLETVLRGGAAPSKAFDGGHFDNPNLLGHFRGTVTPGGQRLMLEEIQSDPIKQLSPALASRVYGDIGEAAIEGAARAGIPSVAFPSAERIGNVRGGTKAFIRDLYDKSLPEQLLTPLSEAGVPMYTHEGWTNVELPPALREQIIQSGVPLKKAKGGRVKETDFMTLSNDPEKRQRQVEFGQAVDRETERVQNVQDLIAAIQTLRAQENTVVRRKPEKPPVDYFDSQQIDRQQAKQLRDLERDIAAANRKGAARPDGTLMGSMRTLGDAFSKDEEAKLMAKVGLGAAGLVGGLAAPLLVPTAPVTSAAVTNVITGLPINLALGSPEGIGQDAIAGAAMGRAASALHPAAALPAALASYAATNINDAEAGGFLRRLVDLPGPAVTARRYTPDERTSMLNELAPYARPRVLTPKASNILTSVLDDAVKQNETTVLYDRFNKPVSMYSMAGRGEPFDDSSYLSGLVSLNGPAGTGHQAAQHAARNSPLEGFRLFSTPTSQGFWDRIVESEPDWIKQYMPEHELEAYRYLPPVNFAGGGLASMAKNMARRSMSAIDELGGHSTAPAGALSVVKNKGGNWLNGSVEDALRGLKKPVREDTYLAQIRSQHDAPEGMYESVLSQNAKANAINSFIDKQLTRYVKNEMATPEDPVRALAERGVLHYDPTNEISGGTLSKAALNRGKTGNVSSGVGESQLAKQWETLSDAGLGVAPADKWRAEASKETLAKMPWLDKLSDEALIYEKQNPNLAGSLGFPHLIDELSNALNPESGLPRHLLLDPKSMDRVSVPQAVERVNAINQWRAAQKAEADARRANNAATVLHKEYPENNPLGLRWVELKETLPTTLEELTPYQLRQAQEHMKHGNLSQEDAIRRAVREDMNSNPLRDALKYEGDTMGHCVGGYCDDVASGRSRIYSLRDAKGQPHVTIEVQPGERSPLRNTMVGHEYDQLLREYNAAVKSGKVDPNIVDVESFYYKGEQPTPRIKQIKGKQNRAPNEEYLPFVQDFVRSGQWSDVGDLQNSGLSRVNWSPETMKELQAYSIPYPEGYGTPDEVNAALNALNKAKGFAHGGSVSAPVTVSDLRAIMAQLRMEHSNA